MVLSQLVAERGSNLAVINPGSANVRIGLARHDIPFNIPHCIARYTNQMPKLNVQDQFTTVQHMEREKAYDIIASLLKVPFLDEEIANNSFPRKEGEVDAVAVVHSYDDGMIAGSHKTRLTALNILGILDFGRDAWIHREDWICNGVHIGSGRKYKYSYYLQAKAMCYINS